MATAKEPAAVADAVAAIAERVAAHEVYGYGIFEYVEAEAGLGAELLVGLRWTEDFGAVLTFGAGGIYTEYLAEQLRPGREVAILSPELTAMLEERATARAARDWARSDELRDALAAAGIAVEDTPDGQRWRRS